MKKIILKSHKQSKSDLPLIRVSIKKTPSSLGINKTDYKTLLAKLYTLEYDEQQHLLIKISANTKLKVNEVIKLNHISAYNKLGLRNIEKHPSKKRLNYLFSGPHGPDDGA